MTRPVRRSGWRISSAAALSVVAGGSERQASVAAGLAALPDGCTVVVVHDAARPFADPQVISAVIERARAGEAAIAAVPVSDTLKQTAADGRTIRADRLA